MTPEIDQIAEVLDGHLGCTLNDGPTSAENTGQDVWSCGIVLPFSERLEDAEQRHRAAAIVAHLAEPRAMTMSHDRLILQRAEQDGGQVVVVRCPHTVGLAFDMEERGMLALLPCPCNDRSEIVAEVVIRPGTDGAS